MPEGSVRAGELKTYLMVRPTIQNSCRLQADEFDIIDHKNLHLRRSGEEQAVFKFTRIFDQKAHSSDIYNQLFIKLAKQVHTVRHALYLYSGVAGSGKTTLLLGRNKPGSLAYFVEELLQVSAACPDLSLHVSMSEYRANYNFYDLFAFDQSPLALDSGPHSLAYPLIFQQIRTMEDFFTLLKVALFNNSSRDFNKNSFIRSRAHKSVFLVNLRLVGPNVDYSALTVDLMALNGQQDIVQDMLSAVSDSNYLPTTPFVRQVAKYACYDRAVILHCISFDQLSQPGTLQYLSFFSRARPRACPSYPIRSTKNLQELSIDVQNKINKIKEQLQLNHRKLIDAKQQETQSLQLAKMRNRLLSLRQAYKGIQDPFSKVFFQGELLVQFHRNLILQNIVVDSQSDLVNGRIDERAQSKIKEELSCRKTKYYYSKRIYLDRLAVLRESCPPCDSFEIVEGFGSKFAGLGEVFSEFGRSIEETFYLSNDNFVKAFVNYDLCSNLIGKVVCGFNSLIQQLENAGLQQKQYIGKLDFLPKVSYLNDIIKLLNSPLLLSGSKPQPNVARKKVRISVERRYISVSELVSSSRKECGSSQQQPKEVRSGTQLCKLAKRQHTKRIRMLQSSAALT